MEGLINDVRDVSPKILEGSVLGNAEAVVRDGEAVVVAKTRTTDVTGRHRGSAPAVRFFHPFWRTCVGTAREWGPGAGGCMAAQADDLSRASGS